MNARSEARPPIIRPLLVVAAALVLAGCNVAGDSGKSERAPARKAAAEPQRAAPDPNALRPARARLDEADAVPEQPAPAGPGDVTRAWFAGNWTDSGDCAEAGRFSPNGTYVLADGTRGMWSVQDGRLVVQGAKGRSALPVRRVDPNTVEITNEDGTTGRSSRCG
jgi:hypothetical protein